MPVLPRFAVAFGILVLLVSAGWIGRPLVEAGTQVSGWLLVTAMAAIGMKTSLASMVKVGPRAMALVVGETLFLCALVLGALTQLA